MKRIITYLGLTAFLLLTQVIVQAQTPNFSEHIAPIIYGNCSSCHRPGGIAPFSLMSYAEVSAHSNAVSSAVVARDMPPWPMDTMSPGFVHERLLTDQEIQDIMDWVIGGKPEGDPNLAPNPPTFSSNYVLGTPDLQLSAPKYTSKAITQDDYVCFTLTNTEPTTKYIEAIEVVPGNMSIVHHCLVYIDDDQSYSEDTLSGACGGPSGETLLGEYTPGTAPLVYPNDGSTKFGVKLKAGSQLVLAIHYPEGSVGQVDSTKINLHFYDDADTTGVREVFANAIIQDWSFCIDSNDVDTVHAVFPTDTSGLQGVFSVLAVFPHMHLIGHEIKTWAITPSNDSIGLGSISHWDFEWQGFYTYKNLKVLPFGSNIYGRAVYDNRAGNHHNPNNPPLPICAGPNTTDEMFLIYFQWLIYNPGDENIDINEILDPDVTSIWEPPESKPLIVSPNPVQSGSTIRMVVPETGDYQLDVISLGGQRVWSESFRSDNRIHRMAPKLSSGVYMISLQNEDHKFHQKLVVVD